MAGRTFEPLAGACWGVPHPFPSLGSGAAPLSFLTPGPRIPGMPRGGDCAAPCPSLWATSSSQAGGRGRGGQSSSVVMTEFAQTWKDRLTCPRLANPPHLSGLTPGTTGEGRNSPLPPRQGPPGIPPFPLLSLPECPGPPRGTPLTIGYQVMVTSPTRRLSSWLWHLRRLYPGVSDPGS